MYSNKALSPDIFAGRSMSGTAQVSRSRPASMLVKRYPLFYFILTGSHGLVGTCNSAETINWHDSPHLASEGFSIGPGAVDGLNSRLECNPPRSRDADSAIQQDWVFDRFWSLWWWCCHNKALPPDFARRSDSRLRDGRLALPPGSPVKRYPLE